jgi:transposase InsO family protein
VAVDYFTKWLEVKPLAMITGKQVVKFVWEQIICRFGLPGKIVSDNGTQFAGNPFRSWCIELEITQIFTSVAHPQSNGQVERMNRSIVEGIKACLEGHAKCWLEEIPSVLWAIRTIEKTSHGHTPYSLTYGSETVIRAEIGIPTHRTKNVSEAANDVELMVNLTLVDERRDMASINEARYKKKMEGYYNQRVRPVTFRPGDLVLRSNEASR